MTRSRRRPLLLVIGAGLLAVAAALAVVTLRTPAVPAEPELATPIDPASGEVSAFPAPGTATISPEAQLSFRGITAAELGEVVIEGAESGEHTGSLLPHGDGAGVSVVPAEPFAPGERVTVRTDLAVRGADDGTYTLTVAVPAPRPEMSEPPVSTVADPHEELAVEHVRTFASAPGLEPPVVEVTGPQAGTVAPDDDGSPGLTVLGVKNGYGQKGPLLVDDAGEPVWFHPLTGVDARDVKVTTYRGEPVLAWWEGVQAVGYGYGEAVLVDTSYTEVARVDMVGYDADAHEVHVTADDTILLMAYAPVAMDLSHVGGPREGTVIDNVVQEIEPETGAVLFEWHGVGAVAVEETYLDELKPDEPYDYLHTNSIDVDDDGDLIVSARHTCTVYSLDRTTASVEWRLGGRRSDFAMAQDAVFLKQHDARRSADGAITVFDNGGTCGERTRESSRGLALDVDEEAMTATVAREHRHPETIFAESQASYEELPGGEVFLGWGSVEKFSLLDADGAVLLDGTIPEDLVVTSYRARRAAWTGEPTTDPAAVVVDGEVRASWNGATEVRQWRVRDAGGTEVAAAPRAGFETAVRLPAPLPTGQLTVEALAADGTVLGATTIE